jgi:hypothetical protein
MTATLRVVSDEWLYYFRYAWLPPLQVDGKSSVKCFFLFVFCFPVFELEAFQDKVRLLETDFS